VSHSTTPADRLARFEALFADHQRHVVAYAMRRTRVPVDAEDVAAETFVIAWRKLDAVPADALPWLYAVARRVLANHRRGLSRRDRLTSLLRVEDVATPVRAGEDLDGPAFDALASLSPADQELLRLVWRGRSLATSRSQRSSGSPRTPSPSDCFVPGGASWKHSTRHLEPTT
jgi:RNA polymerase sigma-70 factor, ECF subfamily